MIVHYIHATSIDKALLIADQGLIPGDLNNTNYENFRWLPLEGVYLSCSPAQTENYLRANGLLDRYAIVLVEADPSALLPDEDLIDTFLSLAMERTFGMDRMQIEDLRGEKENAIPPSGDPFWAKVGNEFLKLADPANTGNLSAEDLETIVDWWADYEFFGEGGDIHPEDWRDLKRRVVEALPRMEGLAPWEKSKRHPGAIGFEGPVRILCIAHVDDGHVEIAYGTPPEGPAKQLLDAMTSH